MATGRRRTRILAVDDSRDVLAAVSRWLETVPDFQLVGMARSGEDALEAAARLAPDVVLIDLAMPGLGGLAATRRLKESARPPLVILVSLHAGEVTRAEALLAGADAFVDKTMLIAELPVVLRRMFGALDAVGPLDADAAARQGRPRAAEEGEA